MFKMWILILFIMLFICSISDIKTRYINIIVIWSALLIAIFIAYVVDFIYGLDILGVVIQGAYGVIPGVAIFIISKMKFGIGEGDAFVIIATGFLSGLGITLYSLFVAFLLSGLYGTIKFSSCHNSEDKAFPFVPFITMGYAICICLVAIKKMEVWL